MDYKELATEKGDVFLMTSDGVHEYISDKDILESLEKDELDQVFDYLTALFVRVDSLPEVFLFRVVHVMNEERSYKVVCMMLIEDLIVTKINL